MGKYYYKGYRIGSIEKAIVQLLLGVKDHELPRDGYNPLWKEIFETAQQKAQFSKVVDRLANKKLLSFKNKHGKVSLVLTQAGTVVARQVLFEKYKISTLPQSWDAKWRIVIFDIPEHKRSLRDLLRFHLKRLGFKYIQGSVWIYPYECGELITLVKTYFELGDEVIYLTADSIEGSELLEKRFNLNRD